MVCLAQPGPFPFSLVEEAQQYFNARFSYNRHFGAVVLAAEDLVLHSSTQWSCSSIMESSPIGCMPHCTVGPAAPHGACCCLVCMLPGQAHGHNPFRKWSRTACHKGSTSHLPSSRPRTTTLQPTTPSTFCPPSPPPPKQKKRKNKPCNAPNFTKKERFKEGKHLPRVCMAAIFVLTELHNTWL